MRLVIRLNGVEAPPRYREQVEARLRLAIGRFGPRIGRVTVYVVDVNGPRGGVDVRCRIVAGLRGCGQVLVEGDGVGAAEATGIAVERLARAAVRAIAMPRRPVPAGPPARDGGSS